MMHATNAQSNRSGSPFGMEFKAHAEIVFDDDVGGVHVATRETKGDRSRRSALRHRSNTLIVGIQ